MATPVTEQLNNLSQQMQSSATGLQNAYLQNQQLGLERAKLEATMNDPIRLLQKQQAQMQLDKIDQEMKTPYNALNALESRDPTDIQYKLANDIYLKTAEGISQATGKVVRYVNDPKDLKAGQFLLSDETGERSISNYEMFSKYGNVMDSITKANYDPEKALESNMVQAKLAYDKAKADGNVQEAENQKKIFEGMSQVAQDPKQLLGIYESKLNYLIDVDAQNKAINPDYKGMDKAITATQDKIENLVKNIDKKEDRQWDLFKLEKQQKFTAELEAWKESQENARFRTRLGVDQNTFMLQQADKLTEEIPTLVDSALKEKGYTLNKNTNQWGKWILSDPYDKSSKQIFQPVSSGFVGNLTNALGFYATTHFDPNQPVKYQVRGWILAGVPREAYKQVRIGTMPVQSEATPTGGVKLKINR